MVQEGIVLGHKISKKGIEVDKAKLDVIDKLAPPANVKGIHSFLGHAGFYRRFIKDFSKIAKQFSKDASKIEKSSIKTSIDFSTMSAKIAIIHLWKVAGALHNPNGMQR